MPAERSGTFQACSTSWGAIGGAGELLPMPTPVPGPHSAHASVCICTCALTGTWDMVTETLRGCTVSWTHCCRLEAKRWGSSALSHASCREQLQTQRQVSV